MLIFHYGQERELEKNKGLKKSIYEDWKLGIIKEDEYYEYVKGYDEKIHQLNSSLKKLYIERATANNESRYDSGWVEKFEMNKNIKELSKEVIDDLVEDIYIHEGGNITIQFKFQDEYQNVIDYIKENKCLLEDEE